MEYYSAIKKNTFESVLMRWMKLGQPTRLPRLWDYPGKNTGVGCHFLLHCMKVKSESEVASVVCDSV